MKRIHRLLLSALSGILLSLPWLGFPGWTLFVAFIPLLILDNFFEKYKQGFPGISFWGHTFLSTLIWNIAASWWMAQASFAGVASAMIFNAFLMSLVWWSAHLIRRNISSSLGYIALVAFWLTYEYLQFNWDMEWPCLQLGSVLASNVQIIQWYEYTGTFGGTLWILILNILLFQVGSHIQEKLFKIKFVSTVVVLGIVLLAPLIISFYMYSLYVEKVNPKHIAIVQPNADPYSEKFDLDSEALKRNSFLRLASEVCTDSTTFLLGPETLFENADIWDEDKLATNCFLIRFRAFAKQFDKLDMVFGVSSFKIYANEDEARYTARNKDGVFYDRYNTALFLNNEGETQLYHKSKLVMGVEKTPMLKYFSFLRNVFIDVGGVSGTLAYDEEASNFTTSDGTIVAPIICFESVFGEYVTQYVKKGAELIFVITNDGWWKNSRGYKQHLLFSQLRSIETRRSFARAANTGTSCFINQCGDVLQPTAWWQEAAIHGTINANDKITFYVKHGDYIGRGAVFVSVLLVLMLIVKRFR